MRISSSAIYDTNVNLLNQQQTKLLHTQQQLASGRRKRLAARCCEFGARCVAAAVE